jgi:anti-anti-sigma regulatory factor
VATFTMTLRIVRESDGRATVIRLIGRIQSEHLDELRAQLANRSAHVVWDLNEVTLVDAGVVRFFNACESQNIGLLHCPPYIREWMARERTATNC